MADIIETSLFLLHSKLTIIVYATEICVTTRTGHGHDQVVKLYGSLGPNDFIRNKHL
jgi:hypothetical protein